MKNKFQTILVILLLSFIANIQAQVNSDYHELDKSNFVEGKIRIKLKRTHLNGLGTINTTSKNATSKQSKIGIDNVDKLRSTYNVTRISRVFPFSLNKEAKHREYGLDLWYEIEYDSNTTPSDLADTYSLLNEVELAKPVYKKIRIDSDSKPQYITSDSLKLKLVSRPSATAKTSAKNGTSLNAVGDSDFDDPLLEQQWHYKNDGTVGIVGGDIDLFKAWTKETGRADIIVSIVDGGIDTDHEDLADHMWVNEAELNGEVGVDDDKNGYIDDIHGYNFKFGGEITDHGHGTHVAGTVGAINNNGIGVAGVAGGDGTDETGVKLMSCQVFDKRAGGGGSFASAIVYGADNGAIISQNSWGYSQPGFYEPEVLDAIRYFIAEAGQYEGSPMNGGIFIAAAGNTGRVEDHYPAAFDEALSVAALGPALTPAPYSTHGDWVDLSAPGGDQSYYTNEGGVLSTLPDDEYGFLQGTSMATPHVSGVAALVISKFGGEGFTPDALRSILVNSTDRFSFESNDKYGIGSLNAANALAEDEVIAPNTIDDLAASEVFHDVIAIEWTVPVDEDNFQPSQFYLAMSESEITKDNFDSQPFLVGFNNPYEAGTKVSVSLGGLKKQTKYWFALKSADRYENVSAISNILAVTTTDVPRFKESGREFEVIIDVNENAKATVPITFSNTGEGTVFWDSYTVNEQEYWIDLTEWSEEAEEKANLVKENSTLLTATTESEVSTSLAAFALSEPDEDKWINDRTVFVNGKTYLQNDVLTDIIGSGNPNIGLIHATRFDMAKNEEFNLTHLRVALFPGTIEPVTIVIKKGSTRIEDAETVYVQKYNVTEEDIEDFSYHRIPLYKPQFFQDEDVFWVEFHFPKLWKFPLGMQKGPYTPDFFKTSIDNGLTYTEAWELLGNKYPSLTIFSTGRNGSYVFMNPSYGEIEAGENQQVEVEIDASLIRNGKHLTSIGVVTNDPNKPGINIEFKTVVIGQEAKVEVPSISEYDAKIGIRNTLDLSVTNIGLSDLIIKDVKSLEGEFYKAFEEDSIIVVSKLRKKITFDFVPDALGKIHKKGLLVTNVGEIPFNILVDSYEAPTAELIINKSDFTVDVSGSEDFVLNIKNTGNATPLNYDLDHYSRVKMENGLNPDKMELVLIPHDDPNAPADNAWTDVTGYGEEYETAFYHTKHFELGFDFPFGSGSYEKFFGLYDGTIYAVGYGRFGDREYPNYRYAGKAMFRAIAFAPGSEYRIKLNKMHKHSFGDRVVFSFDQNIIKVNSEGISKFGDFEYQIVFFRDGAIEFRYKNMDNFLNAGIESNEYLLGGIQGLEEDDYRFYKNVDQTDKLVYNGLTFRYETLNAASAIVLDGNTKGVVAPGESIDIPLKIEPGVANLFAGSYINRLFVNTNTNNQTEFLPHNLNIEVTSNEYSTTVQDTLSFGDVNIITEPVKDLKIINDGTSEVTLDNIVFANSVYTINENLPIKLAGKSNYLLPIHLNPIKGSMDAIATLTFSDGSSHNVEIDAQGGENPTYVSSFLEQPLSFTVEGGKTLDVPFSIENTSADANLDYMFKNGTYANVYNETAKNGNGTNTTELDELYGYSWKVSNDENPFYKWNDITSKADTLFIQQDVQEKVFLPFNFPFYGEEFSEIWISRNGYITVVEPEKDDPIVEFEIDDGLAGIIAPFLSSLVPTKEGSGVLVEIQDDRITIQWSDYVDPTGYGGGPITFQLEMLENGQIFFHYENITAFRGGLQYGLESPDESEKFETPRSWILKWSIVKTFSTIAIAPPLKDQITDTQDLNLKISAERLTKKGIYKDTLQLITNSHSQRSLLLPIEINVTGGAIMETDDVVDFGSKVYEPGETVLEKTVTIANIGYEELVLDGADIKGIENLEIIDSEENRHYVINGKLLPNITIASNSSKEFKFALEPNAVQQYNGSITYFSNNVELKTTELIASSVTSPMFSWTAENQNYSVIETEKKEYTFSISNSGTTDLEYRFPTVSGDGTLEKTIIEEVGNYSLEGPRVIDSLANDTKDAADGVVTPFVHGSLVTFGSEFTAPVGGFHITHVQAHNYLKKVGEYVKVRVYVGGDAPESDESNLMYEEKYVINRYANKEWVYYPLKKPITIPEGEKFWVTVITPQDLHYSGFELSNDEEVLDKSWVGIYQNWVNGGTWKWSSGNDGMGYVYKFRPLTSIGDDSWISIDKTRGIVKQGESVDITATIDPLEAVSNGIHEGRINVVSNDINNKKSSVDILININGAPVFDFIPNQYVDSLNIVETELKSLNYVFSDPESDEMDITISNLTSNDIVKSFERTGDNTAKIVLNTNYESGGAYAYALKLTDAVGNTTMDTLKISVKEKNRAPVLNEEFQQIHLNYADPNEVLTINIKDLFTDPDGDDLQILVGNYTPDMLDLAMGREFINLHPKRQGTGFIVLGADDGKENGFVLYGVYVLIIDDPDAITTSPSSLVEENVGILNELGKNIAVYPNPTVNGNTNVLFKLNDAAQVNFDIYNLNGQKVLSGFSGDRKAGLHTENLNVSGLNQGLYICRYIVNGVPTEITKLIIK